MTTNAGHIEDVLDMVVIASNRHVTWSSLKTASSQRRLGPSPIHKVRITTGWIPAYAGMTNISMLQPWQEIERLAGELVVALKKMKHYFKELSV